MEIDKLSMLHPSLLYGLQKMQPNILKEMRAHKRMIDAPQKNEALRMVDFLSKKEATLDTELKAPSINEQL